jgi:hypothetical protein
MSALSMDNHVDTAIVLRRLHDVNRRRDLEQ